MQEVKEEHRFCQIEVMPSLKIQMAPKFHKNRNTTE